MLREKYTNAAATTLNGSISNSVTSVTVTDASTWPTGAFRVKCENEIMYVTSRASNVLTVVRGYEGTTAASHADTTAINHVITAGVLDRYRLGILSDIGLVPYEDSLSASDDEFDDENFTGWTSVNTTPALVSTAERDHRFSAVLPTGTASAQLYAWLKTKTPSAGDWVQAGFQLTSGGSAFPMFGVMMADGTTYGSGKQIKWHYSVNEQLYALHPHTGFNTGGTAITFGTINFVPCTAIHLRLKWNSNDNYDCLASHNGRDWAVIGASQSSGTMGAAPTQMGFFFTTWGASRQHVFSAHYCRFSF